ncbi:MAG: xanthine dehydrogenase family protein molybdopterin-binding subunit [Proteobacteria bacterium]|nr:xanthine dehydrogenase family protein molybdopterin-binding subunit [Pseudomonadota bacterium]
MGENAFGQSVRRLEDAKLLTGGGVFIDDRCLPDQCHGAVLRSPHAHARIARIDTSRAAAAPGVLAVLTGLDYLADGLDPIACGMNLPTFPPGSKAPGALKRPPFPALAHERVRYVGDSVAFVVAERVEQARDALELIEVDYEPLAAVTDGPAALAPDAPPLFAEAPGNVAFRWQGGDAEAVDAAFNRAHHVTRLEVVNNRIIMVAMETRGAIGQFDAATGRFTLYTASQMPHGLKKSLKTVLHVEEKQVRVAVADVGGGFGLKNSLYPEQVMVLWAARRLGRPVKWVGERGDAFLTDYHGRDNIWVGELALDRDGNFLALRASSIANLGAYLAPRGMSSPVMNTPALAGVYRTPAIHVTVTGVFTNTAPTDVYRGAGRPEALYLLERLVEVAASELKLDPLVLRRRNLIRPADLPRRTPLGLLYDSGDFEAVLDQALARAGHGQFPARRSEAAKRGRLRGFGLCHYVERIAGGWSEDAELRIDADGRATVLIGQMSNGQGHVTAYTQLVADRLGLGLDEVTVIEGDTDLVATGAGTGGSASLVLGGAALHGALLDVVAQATPEAAHALEAAEADVEFSEGHFRIVGTDRALAFRQVAQSIARKTGKSVVLAAQNHFQPTNHTYPNGCHVCEVEVDPDTGQFRIVGYTMVHDFGRILNPMLLEGQLHGGITQGLGQAAFERVVYDGGSGQLLTGSLMDYCLPRADDLPSFSFLSAETASPASPIGVKGCGEAGCAGAPAALINAVVDALAPLGIRHIDMPVTAEALWRAIAESAARKAA